MFNAPGVATRRAPPSLSGPWRSLLNASNGGVGNGVLSHQASQTSKATNLDMGLGRRVTTLVGAHPLRGNVRLPCILETQALAMLRQRFVGGMFNHSTCCPRKVWL